jgi:hypothetical protein
MNPSCGLQLGFSKKVEDSNEMVKFNKKLGLALLVVNDFQDTVL